MTVEPETHLRARLLASSAVSSLVSSISPSSSSEQTALPRVVYTRLSRDGQHHMGGAAGLVFLRIQFDIFAATQSQAAAIADAFRNRLDGFRGTITTLTESRFFGFVKLETDQDEPIPPTDGSDQITFRRSLDFFVSCEEPVPTLTA